MNREISPALSSSALFAKSKIYMGRGLRAKNENNFDEYQLWASLALELLAKSSLSKQHPALVADPQHYKSLFSACGIPLSPDVKTITAKTLFERLSHITKQFDQRTQQFCIQQALRRNSEIHSGESPFSGMSPEQWEPKFWYAAQILLELQEKDLEQWLGADESQAPGQLLLETQNAIARVVETKINRASENFRQKYRSASEREKEIALSKREKPYGHSEGFDFTADHYQSHECPACGGGGILAGIQYHEEISEEQDLDDPFFEYIDVTYVVDEYVCLACDLHLLGFQEIHASTLPDGFWETEAREREFEPDYGND